jgi:hypothetical protein
VRGSERSKRVFGTTRRLELSPIRDRFTLGLKIVARILGVRRMDD